MSEQGEMADFSDVFFTIFFSQKTDSFPPFIGNHAAFSYKSCRRVYHIMQPFPIKHTAVWQKT